MLDALRKALPGFSGHQMDEWVTALVADRDALRTQVNDLLAPIVAEGQIEANEFGARAAVKAGVLRDLAAEWDATGTATIAAHRLRERADRIEKEAANGTN
jgi:hypothetical protein